jgi:beta-N-acetylhexosaminidase
VIIAAYVRRIEGSGRPAVPPHIAKWIDDVAKKHKVIAVALGNPYLIRQFPNVGTYLVTYGVSDALEHAAAAVVLGKAPATGTTPVSLPGFFKRGDGLRR